MKMSGIHRLLEWIPFSTDSPWHYHCYANDNKYYRR